MHGLEAVVVRLASTVAQTVAKSTRQQHGTPFPADSAT